jgi:hypothetical protein
MEFSTIPNAGEVKTGFNLPGRLSVTTGDENDGTGLISFHFHGFIPESFQ